MVLVVGKEAEVTNYNTNDAELRKDIEEGEEKNAKRNKA